MTDVNQYIIYNLDLFLLKYFYDIVLGILVVFEFYEQFNFVIFQMGERY